MFEFKSVSLKEIKPDPKQPRKYFDDAAMKELTLSVNEKGVLQPILLRPDEKGYLLVCGERRYKAAEAAGLTEIPATVRDLTDDEALEMQIIENLQRKDVHPMEEAIAFKSLAENKSRTLTMEDIAAKVGKTVYFVRQRIKLNALSKDWQEVFYKNKVSVSDALEIARLAEKEQQTLYAATVNKKDLSKADYEPRITNWDIDNLRRSLKKAPFDTKDETLNPKMGACTHCPFNTAVASLFPEDAKDPICNNAGCYQVKSHVSFERQLKIVLEDPSVVLIKSYRRNDDDETLLKTLSKEHKIYSTSSWDDGLVCSIQQPVKKDIEAGKIIKGFYVAGEERGQTAYVQIGKPKINSRNSFEPKTADKIKEGKATASDIDSEIERIKDREERSKELDAEKIHKNILDALNPENKGLNFSLQPYQKIDRGIMIFLLLRAGDYQFHNALKKMKFLPQEPFKNGYQQEYLKLLSKITDDQLSVLIRELAWNKHGNKNMVYGIRAEDTLLYEIAGYSGYNVTGIEAEQKAVAEKRIEPVNKRIADLNETKKQLQKDVKPKATPKKAKKK